MLKILKNIYYFFCLLIISLVFIPIDVFAISPEYKNPSEYNISTNDSGKFSYDYVLNGYDIDIVVNENNTLKITERIDTYFNVEKHGIYRKIPFKNEVKRLDGSISLNRAKITDISVNDNYSLYDENGYKVIKIGDEDYTLTGQKTYIISYLYNLGKDTGKGYDELYFNLIGSEWSNTIIDNITFTITMPKEFDESKLGFSSGFIGSTDGSNVIYNVDGNVITGKLIGTLEFGKVLTVRLQLPEGYFIGASSNLDLTIILSIVLPILFLLISYLIWIKFGKDEKIIETVEFYPPQGLNSLEVGFLYKGKADYQDVTSLLIYLTNKGYIKLSETEEKTIFPEIQNYKITKLKEYDGNNVYEWKFLYDLFNKKKDNANDVMLSDLMNSFYVTMDDILVDINNKENQNKIFEKSISIKKRFIILMIILTYCLSMIFPFYYYICDNLGLLFCNCFMITVMFILLFREPKPFYKDGKLSKSCFAERLVGIFLGVFGFLILWCPLFLFYSFDIMCLIIYIIGLLCIFGMITCLKYLSKRTTYGNEMLKKIMGFKNFLETVEKQKLEKIVMQNPNYFYDILPYTYVLGISDKWIENFEAISLKIVPYLNFYSDINMINFSSSIDSLSYVMSYDSSKQSSDGGFSASGSSGGGFSGGGSGGGGGGSW